jgi:hypothetical protein
VVLLRQVVRVAKMRRVLLVKMLKGIKKVLVEKVLQEKVVKKEQRKQTSNLQKVRIIIQCKSLTKLSINLLNV